MVSAPSYPDPAQTAATQGQMNRETAITQQQLNMVNQQTPYGSLTYSQTGQNFTPSDSGQTYYYNPSTGEYRTDAPVVAGTASSTGVATPSLSTQRRTRDGEMISLGPTQAVGGAATASSQLQDGWQQVQGLLTPSYTATQTLSPEQQAILGQTQGAQLNLATLANERSNFLRDYLGQSMDTSGAPELVSSFNRDWSGDRQRVEQALLDRMQPQQEQDQTALRSTLIAQGIRPGTEAWDAEWNRNQQGVNDARMSAILAGGQEQSRLAGLDQAAGTFQNQARSQYLNEAYAERSQPINEIAALLGGSQVTNPNFVSTPQTSVGGVDYTGLVGDKYAAEQQAYGATMGGLFGLAAAPFSMFSIPKITSDRRLKRDIERIGAIGRLPWYRFSYVWDDPMAAPRFGFMADEVARIAPHAVATDAAGYESVDYVLAMEAA
ncbi:hypothetical protein FHS55_002631 [Angulomicrobium tetraedrale]|uniref:Peptidase S74 domain-containing protein n=1 Tax=Ancylobacter tetraedralis TaxID=217068 RepID=A0A839ZBE4_9HYPH|nr:tail fiber domain-containing protein [Ancylobacter tetraedralis]MBB3772022.1 hypothetical protein [Ancylobacter tetraedralis]